MRQSSASTLNATRNWIAVNSTVPIARPATAPRPGLREGAASHAHAGQVGDGDPPVALPPGAPPGREVSQLRIDLVARDGARRDRVPQVAVPLGLEHAVGDELVRPGEDGGLE